jgi:hypothetical protein
MVVAVALPLAAQEKSGTVEGIVTDADGVALPGVTIVGSGANMMGTRNTVTDQNGTFRFVNVPPGEYTLTATLAGFQPLKQDLVPVALGKTVHLDMKMESGFGDTIEVTSESFQIDTTSSKVGANITDEFISSMPTDRQYQMVMSILPGAIEGNNPIMHGSSSADNMYLMDGMTSVDPMTNTWSTAINFDTIQEVQVATGGITAEYGRGTGALVNMLTKSGSNEFHGILRAHVTDTDWNAEPDEGKFYFSDSTRYITETRWGANLGGPIMRDHLWFFLSWEERGKEKPYSIWATPEDLLAAGDSGDIEGNRTVGPAPYAGHYGQVKLTWSPTASNTFMVQYMDDPIDFPNYRYRGYSTRGEGAEVTQEQGGYNYMATWTGILSDNSFLDAKYNAKRNDLNQVGPAGGTTYRITNSAGTIYWNSPTRFYESKRDYDVMSVNYSRFVDDFGGDHNFKAGLEYFKIDGGQNYNYYPGNGEYIRLTSDGEDPYYRYLYTQQRGWQNYDTTNWTLFLQDSWQVTSKLTLNLGLRFESLVEQTPTGFKGLDWGFGDRIAPRLGFAYAIGDKGQSNLHGSAGRYYDVFGSYVTRTFVETPNLQYTFQYWNSDLGDWDPDRTYHYDIGAASASLFPLDAPYMDEFTLGYEGRVSDTMSWSVDAIYRTWEKGVEDDDGQYFEEFPDNPPNDGNYVFMNLGNYRKYKGIEVSLRKRLGAGKYQFLTSYTYSDTSSLWGNSDYATGYADNPFNYYNYQGRTTFDYRHLFKVNGSYFLPYNFMIGTNFTYYSAQPYSIDADVETSAGSQWEGQSFGGYRPEPQGSRERPSHYRWDLRFEWNVGIGKGMSIGLYADIFNVTNTQPVRAVDGYYGVIEIDEPGQQIDNNGVPVDTSDFEGQPDEWQAPRSYFFGAKFEF